MFKRFLSGARSEVPAPAVSAVPVVLNAPKESSALNRPQERSVLNPVLRSLSLASLLAVLTVGIFSSASAFAASAAPSSHLTLHTRALPTQFSSADNEDCITQGGLDRAATPPCDGYQVTVTNSGSVRDGGPVTLTDTLPAGLKVVSVYLFWSKNRVLNEEGSEGYEGNELYPEDVISGEPTTLCKTETGPERVSCEFPPVVGELEPAQRLEMDVFVTVENGAASSENTAGVAEAGTTVASASEDDVLGAGALSFGASAFVSEIGGADGRSDVQAGDHPYDLATRFDLYTRMGVNTANEYAPATVGQARDVVVDLPLGVAGSAVATPRCTFAQLQSHVIAGFPNSCPLDTLVGHVTSEPKGLIVVYSAIYNMVPEPGVVAEFGYTDLLHNTHVIVATVAPTPTGYVTRAIAREVPQLTLSNVITTFYGDPAAKQEEIARLEGAEPHPVTPAAMFTNPSDCSGEPLKTQLYMDSWQAPGAFNADGTPNVEGHGWVSASIEAPPVTGCNALRFTPESFTFAPEAGHSQADEPSGYESVLKIPANETPGTLATPPLKTTVVTLPPGVSISPAAADGLVGCQESGPEGINFEQAGPGNCPAASKVGTVEVATPLLPERLSEGSVYVAQPTCGGSGQPQCSEALAEEGKLFAIYLEISSKERGIHIKLRGKVEVGGAGHSNGLEPGQVRTSFIKTPQMPFSELKFKFDGGPRAPLANPQTCGTFTTNASLEPWSAPESGPNAIEQPSFNISGGCGNGFAPSFSAGTTNDQAGAYSAFTTTFSRHGGEQDLSGVTVNMPEGLSAKIAGIPQCPEAQANAGTCSSASKIGTATGAAGSGSDPLYQSGPVYLTGPYNGGPFGLSIVIPANAGPYNLGNIVVRASIRINPVTAAATIVSNPLPQSIDGIPLRVQTVNVTVGQENNFTFNPTNCTPSAINATITSAQGTAVPVSSPFDATGCATLPFHPQFSASTNGKTSRANGASFHVKIGFPTGGQANIHRVELTIPSVLPSRLTTLQKACPEAVFNANPAACPSASLIATATAHTPLLPDPLMGPVYFVSHGGAAFPDTEMVLQGDNVELIIDGHTDIKKGVTYSRFQTVPDAPVTSFEFSAPEGPYSIFAAYGNLCQKEIKAPTTITAQNGAVFSQDTAVEVQNCPNTLTILSHTVKKRTITLKVAVPGPGRLTATGKGLTKTTKTAGARGTVTLTLKATGSGKLNTKVKLSFAPTKGKKLAASVSARFKR